MDGHAQFFPDEIRERELPPCDLEHLDELLLLLKTSHPTVRAKLLRDLAADDGAYVVKLLDLFDVSEIDAEKRVLHRIFDIFYALLELCDRRVLEILLSDQNFLSVVGVLGHNPGLIREMDFRADLEGSAGFKEVLPLTDESVRRRVHLNFRIHVIKDNVLSRSLPDCAVIMLDHIVNENNYHILSYISDSEAYWQGIKALVRETSAPERRRGGLGLLKEVIQLVRTTRPLDKLPQQLRRDGFGAPPVFGQLLNNLFGDGAIFEAFSDILGSPQSKVDDIELALDILNTLVFYQGPERLRTFLASEGKCIAPPTSDKERIQWKTGASLFTALICVFEQYEPTRVQMFTLLKEIFKVSLPQDDKFLNVMYPNYIHWLLQPLKYISVDDEATLFALQDSIMELLTFCTEAHGYRIKYLFGRQPIASYVDRMLRSRNKLFVIHAVKFIRACAARGEAFFSRFLVQNDLFTPLMQKLKSGQRNTCAVSSAILELLAYIEKANLSSLVEHIYNKFYTTYKDECPIVFEALRVRYEDTFGSSGMSKEADQERENVLFVQRTSAMTDEDDSRYWETDDPAENFSPSFVKEEVPTEVRCRAPDTTKLVDYADDDEPASPLKEGDLMIPSPREDTANGNADSSEETKSNGDSGAHESSNGDDNEDDDFKLPVREKKVDDEPSSFLSGGLNGRKLHTKKVKSPQYKTMFQQISWKMASPSDSSSHEGSPDSTDATSVDAANGRAEGSDSSSPPTKRKIEIDAPPSPESILKKAKPCTPVSSS